jgi:hypothetical protein
MPVMHSVGTMITQLEGLLGTNDLTEWEQAFVRDVATRTAMARKMGLATELAEGTVAKIEQIYRKHFA